MQGCLTVSAAPTERTASVAGIECRWFEAAGPAPVLYLHGVPNTGHMWGPFMARTGGIAPDLPGFGISGKPADFDYSIDGYGRWLHAFLDDRGIDRYSLVCHDWGAVGLVLAQAEPERLERLVLIDAVPLLPGYEWHTLARRWRQLGVGEMAMGFTFKRILQRLLQLPDGRPFPAAEVDEIWDHFDHGTQRAILRLYRSAPPAVLEAAGARLGELTCPSLVLWGGADPYIDERFARDYADALGGDTTVDIVSGGGHWVWHGDPAVIDSVAGFLGC